MPNYVYNVLTVYGNGENSQKDVVAFLKQHINDNNMFDFNTIIPEPIDESEVEDEFNFNKTKTEDKDVFDNIGKPWFNWYDWRYKHWGVKWNCTGNHCFDYDKILNSETGIHGKIQFVIKTAWYPPVPVIKKLIKIHPELNIDCDYYSCESMVYGWIGNPFGKIEHEHYKIIGKYNKKDDWSEIL